ncbi:MAG: hypothetical protein QOG31_917 [Thermoplasmata archaeon]|nr:hypothetical protein [Thermoplasmata archaeon]
MRAAVDLAFRQESTDGLFNPYRPERATAFDVPDAHERRRANLRNFIALPRVDEPVLVVGEAPGWRGCRFSGVPFTSERQLVREARPFRGVQSSNGRWSSEASGLAPGAPVWEQTAEDFWAVMKDWPLYFLAWNACPWHPHEAGEPFTNAKPTRAALEAGASVLQAVVAAARPRHIVAIGNTGADALARIGIDDSRVTRVRHPARGGGPQFRSQISTVLEACFPSEKRRPTTPSSKLAMFDGK